MKILLTFLSVILNTILIEAACPCASKQYPASYFQNLSPATLNRAAEILLAKSGRVLPNYPQTRICNLPLAKKYEIGTPISLLNQIAPTSSCQNILLAPVQNLPVAVPTTPPPVAALSYCSPSSPTPAPTCCPPTPAPLINPFLPAASPISALAPPVSNLLPPMQPTQTRNQYLRKIPIPPPTL